MAFIEASVLGQVYAPGWFLAHEECVRKTYEIPASGATSGPNGGSYVKAGTPYPSNNGSCIGLVYEDVDVTAGDMPGSVVLKGVVYEGRLPVTLASAAKSALTSAGFTFLTEPEVTRPEEDDGED